LGEITFSAMAIADGAGNPIGSQKLKMLSPSEWENDKENYEIDVRHCPNGEWVWLHFQYGRAQPYSDKVFHKALKTTQPNPRSIEQAELKQQLFALYQESTSNLFVSDLRKKGALGSYLTGKLGEPVYVKNIYSSPEDFCKQISSISSITLSSDLGLLSHQIGLFKATADLFGLDSAENFNLRVDFGHAKIGDKFLASLKEAVNRQKTGEIRGMVCVGKNDDNIESIFNIDTLVKRYRIPCDDVDGMYPEAMVHQLLLDRL
jgi:hypothetical protein